MLPRPQGIDGHRITAREEDGESERGKAASDGTLLVDRTRATRRDSRLGRAVEPYGIDCRGKVTQTIFHVDSILLQLHLSKPLLRTEAFFLAMQLTSKHY